MLSYKDYCNFLTIAFGSGSELETQLEIAEKLKFTDKNIELYEQASSLLQEVMPMLNGIIQKLRS